MVSPDTLPVSVIVAGGEAFKRAVTCSLAQSRSVVLAGEADDISTLCRLLTELKVRLALLDANHFGSATPEVVYQVGLQAPTCRIFVVADDDCDNLVMDALRKGAHGHAVKNEGLWEILPEALSTVASGTAVISPRMAGHILDEMIHIRQSPRKHQPPRRSPRLG